LVELKAIKEQEEVTYQDVCLEASKRWQHSLEFRGHHGQLVSVPLLAEIKAKYSLERLKKQFDADVLAIYFNWCNQQGWTDLFVNEGSFWAFPPCAVLPLLVSEAW
jgi:5,10-methylene-tetrahydrofolate dehydrogenase/methenyl tetrahydrofolate cyclohydrolase